MKTIRAMSIMAPISLGTIPFLIAPLTADAQQIVGAVGAANASATGRAPNHAARGLAPGGSIFFKDRISTKIGGSAQLTFLDRSTLNIGENSDVVIDEFVYRPAEGVGGMSASLTKGVLRFVGGDISHGGGTVFKTPVVTIGIRGGIGTIVSLPDGARMRDIPSAPATFHGGTIVVNGFGTLSIRNAVSEQIISRPGFAVFVGAADAPIAAPVRFDMAAMKMITAQLSSRVGQNGGVVARPFVSGSPGLSTRFPVIDIPLGLPLRPTLNGLDFTATVSVGSAVAKARTQAQHSIQLQQQISTAPSVAMPAGIAATPGVASLAPAPVVAQVPSTNTPIVPSPTVMPQIATVPPAPTVVLPAATIPVATTITGATPITTPIAGTPTVATPAVTSAVTTPIAAVTAPVTKVVPPVSIPAVSTPVISTPVASTPVVSTPVVSTPSVSTPAVTSTVATPVAAITANVPAVTPAVSTPAVTSTVAKPVASVTSTVQTVTPTATVATTPVATTSLVKSIGTK